MASSNRTFSLLENYYQAIEATCSIAYLIGITQIWDDQLILQHDKTSSLLFFIFTEINVRTQIRALLKQLHSQKKSAIIFLKHTVCWASLIPSEANATWSRLKVWLYNMSRWPSYLFKFKENKSSMLEVKCACYCKVW